MEFVRQSAEALFRMQAIAVEDVDDEVAHWHPGGNANTIAQLLAHFVTGQDLLFNGKVLGGKSLHESGWAGRTGIPVNRADIWVRDGWRLRLAPFNEYRLAVEDSIRRYLSSATAADLDREVEWVRGPIATLGQRLQTVFIHHAFGHCGEISAIKGMQGLKGLPM
ncbi:MAG TPA: DinB family protein [Dehalococcoidia bacterium]|nr:DinB family protein [Dehalococcoidia bacterium]